MPHLSVFVFLPPVYAGVDAFCLILDITSNMAGVGLLKRDESAVCCWGLVGSGTSGTNTVNFCFTRFDCRCINATGSGLVAIPVVGLRFNVGGLFTCLSGLPDIIFSQLNCWCERSTGEAGVFRVILQQHINKAYNALWGKWNTEQTYSISDSWRNGKR